MTTDHLGSPRVVTDERGSVSSRRDFTAFGEESFTAQRTQGLGYQPTEVRKDYTGYEKDEESGLEFAQARHYNPTHGRFTSVDPLTASATIRNPQTFNRYSYGLNSPYKFTDPLGLLSQYTTGACGGDCPNSDGSSGGWTSDYYSGQLNGPQENMVDDFVSRFGLAALFATFPLLHFDNSKLLRLRIQDNKNLLNEKTRAAMQKEIASIYKDINVIVDFTTEAADYDLVVAPNNTGYTKSKDAFGVTLPDSKGLPTNFGYVFVNDVMRLAQTPGKESTLPAGDFNKDVDKNLGIALGRAASHEVAHYLLNMSGHTSKGIMSATFYGFDWFGSGESRGKWFFKGSQKKTIRALLPDAVTIND